MIEVSNVTKKFGNFKALDNASLSVAKGSVYGLVGPNGAGKTTIIKHLTGILKQDSGRVCIDGEELYENTAAKAKVFYIPDDLFFFSQYSVIDLAKFYSGFYPEWSWQRFDSLSSVFNIAKNKRIIRLSKGMQKQVAFWMAISSMAKVMVLDEPVDGLDPVMRKKVWSLVLQDVAERQTAVLVSSHNLRELEDVCDFVGIMHQGKVIAQRELDSLKSDIHKVQVAFQTESKIIQSGKLNILNVEKNGSIYKLIVKGNKEQIIEEIQKERPILFDVLPLSLEEVFIYELGGLGYDIQSVII